MLDHAYFGESHTILAFTNLNRVWQSHNEGFSWSEAVPNTHILAMTMHAYNRERSYLITETRTVHFSIDKGSTWHTFEAPADPNGLGIPVLDFHPINPDWLIWTGQIDCGETDSQTCRAVAYFTKDNGRSWSKLDEYVRVCSWGRDKKLRIDEKIIFCESYRDKKGSQRAVYQNNNPLQLVAGEYFYSRKKVLFDNIVGFATFEEYMVAAQVSILPKFALDRGFFSLTPAVSGFGTADQRQLARDQSAGFDGRQDVCARALPTQHATRESGESGGGVDSRLLKTDPRRAKAYTVLESTTDSVFLHVTTHADIGSEWGTLFKSNWNGTYYSPSLEYVNRNGKGFVDFEKMIGLDGIAVINVVSNPDEATLSSNKKLQTRITHNDGGRWKRMIPPAKDSLGQRYDCSSTVSLALLLLPFDMWC